LQTNNYTQQYYKHTHTAHITQTTHTPHINYKQKLQTTTIRINVDGGNTVT